MRQAKAFPIAVALGLGLAGQVAAEQPPLPAVNAANALIDKARRCSDSSAEQFAKVAGETADTIAAAAFDKCKELWSTATEKLISALLAEVPPLTKELINKNSYMISEHFKYTNEISDENSIEHWREAEIRRLRVFILELRSKAPSP
jgi:hypothetical protein